MIDGLRFLLYLELAENSRYRKTFLRNIGSAFGDDAIQEAGKVFDLHVEAKAQGRRLCYADYLTAAKASGDTAKEGDGDSCQERPASQREAERAPTLGYQLRNAVLGPFYKPLGGYIAAWAVVVVIAPRSGDPPSIRDLALLFLLITIFVLTIWLATIAWIVARRLRRPGFLYSLLVLLVPFGGVIAFLLLWRVSSEMRRRLEHSMAKWFADCESILDSLSSEERDEVERRWSVDPDWTPSCFPPRPEINRE